MSNEAQNGNFAKPVLSAVPFPNLIDDIEWYAKKKHAEIVYRKCVKAKRYKWAMKIAYHYGLQDESRNDDTVMALGLALMSVKNTKMKDLKTPQELNESSENLNISGVSDSKKYVYKYNHNGKDLYYYVDDVEGDMFVSDINDARIFTGKQIKSFQLDNAFDLGSEIYCEEEGGYITLVEKPVRIEV